MHPSKKRFEKETGAGLDEVFGMSDDDFEEPEVSVEVEMVEPIDSDDPEVSMRAVKKKLDELYSILEGY